MQPWLWTSNYFNDMIIIKVMGNWMGWCWGDGRGGDDQISMVMTKNWLPRKMRLASPRLQPYGEDRMFWYHPIKVSCHLISILTHLQRNFATHAFEACLTWCWMMTNHRDYLFPPETHPISTPFNWVRWRFTFLMRKYRCGVDSGEVM